LAVEYLSAQDSVRLVERYFSRLFCISWDYAALAKALREKPEMGLKLSGKWYGRWKQERQYLETVKKEREKNMLTVSGSAEFVSDGRVLLVETRIQPTYPQQHDMLERLLSAIPENDRIYMDRGQLVIKHHLLVPAVLPQASPETESGSPSMATSAKTEPGDVIGGISGAGLLVTADGVAQEGKPSEGGEGAVLPEKPVVN
jgi:hypothetical protein